MGYHESLEYPVPHLVGCSAGSRVRELSSAAVEAEDSDGFGERNGSGVEEPRRTLAAR